MHVDAVGKTPENAKREIRIWMTSVEIVTADKASASVQRCERAGIEPCMATADGGRVVLDAHRPGLVILDAPAIAVEIRETDVESFVHDLATKGDGASDGEDGGPDSEGDDGGAEGPKDDEADENDVADRLTHRETFTKVGAYVAGGLVTYLAIERVSDVVQQSPELHAAAVHCVVWLDVRFPDVRLPPVEWSIPTPQPLSERSTLLSRTTAISAPVGATTIPYAGLRERPEAYTGTAVTYAGRIKEMMECDETRLALVAVEDDRGRLSGGVVVRWLIGRFFDDNIGFRLLTDERVRPWGVVAGEDSVSSDVRYSRIDVSVLEKT